MWMMPAIHRFLTELVRLKWLNIYNGQVLFFFLKMEQDGGVRDWKNKANIHPCWPNKLGQWRIYNVAFGESFACGTRRVVPSERMDYLRSMRSSWWDNSQIFLACLCTERNRPSSINSQKRTKSVVAICPHSRPSVWALSNPNSPS